MATMLMNPRLPRSLRFALCLAVAAAGTSCAIRSTYSARPLPPEEQAQARDQVRLYAKSHCGRCHQSSLPTANPAALAIYNLDRDDWASMLTEQRLRNGFPRRLNARLDEAGQLQLRRFIESELATRTRPPSG